MASFLAAFYTDVFGISPEAAGTLLFVTRIVDAFTDPVMGAVADRTRSRWGKFRPYLLFGGLPLAAAGVLTFSTPDLEGGAKLVYAYATYTTLMLAYTLVNMPYSALSGVMTAHGGERTTLISVRFLFAFTGGALVNKYTLPLVEAFGAGDAQLGWQRTMMLYGAVAIALCVVTFATTRERIAPPPAQRSSPVQDLRDLLASRPWLILFMLAMLIMMTVTLRAGSAYYFFTYYLKRPDLLPDYLLLQMVAYATGALCAPILVRHVEKARLVAWLMGIVGALSLMFYFVPAESIWLMFVLNGLISLALGPKSPLTWSMYADTADHNEWLHGRRATAMTFAAATFSQKLGGSLASAGMLWLLAWLGYVANQAQQGASLDGIHLMQTILPGVFALLAMLAVSFYTLGGAELARIQRDLDARARSS
jgi:GPH family glycoside/pentoside/hexuronide:cation symporter